MTPIQVEICLCNSCLFHGASELLEAVESLSELRDQMDPFGQHPLVSLEIHTSPYLKTGSIPHQSPMVSINGELICKAAGDDVMCRLVDLATKATQKV